MKRRLQIVLAGLLIAGGIEVALLAAHNHAVIASREEGSERKILECQGPDLKKLKWLGRFVYNIP